MQDRPGHDRRYALDTARTRRQIGWEPSVSFAEGLERTVRWYLANRPWWEEVKTGAYRRYAEEWYRRLGLLVG